MKTVKIGKHLAELYDSIEELPVVRYHKYQKYLLIDSGIGATIEDFDKHIEKARRYCMTDDTANAQKELENLRQSVYMIQSELSPRHLAFACLVFSIDGKQCTDITDDGLRKIVENFSNASIKDLTDCIESVKKKIEAELALYFPKLTEGAEAKEFFDILRNRTLLVLKNIIAGFTNPDTTREVEEITTKLITFSNPQTFSGSDSIEIKFDRQFENLCISLSSQLGINPKQYTVMEFYNAVEYLKEKIKAEEKALNKADKRR